MSKRFPDYDVLRKRDSPSWNSQTRDVVDERLALASRERWFLDDLARLTLHALCESIAPQREDAGRRIPTAAMLDERLAKNQGDGYRRAELPPLRDAWRIGLAAMEKEARRRRGVAFHALAREERDEILHDIQSGRVDPGDWSGMPPDLFFTERVLPDILSQYYSHPEAWNEIGFGGPASPRGYVRMGFDMRDPWEAAEAKSSDDESARRANRRV